MPSTAEQFKVELRKLPVKERAELAHFLIESLDNEEGEAWEAAWRAELNRRIESVKNGTTVLEPGDELLARWREKYP